MIFHCFSLYLQLVILGANLTYGLWIVIQGIQGWEDSPTTTSIETVAAPAKDAPFPAVAVCPPVDHVHNSWRTTAIAYDMLDVANCKGADCSSAVLKFRKSFRDFTDKLVDQHLASDEPSEYKLDNEEGIPTKVAGGFFVSNGYKGIKFTYVFRLLYCELAKVLEQKNDPDLIEKLTVRLKNAFLGLEDLDLDVLLQEENLVLEIEDLTIYDNFFKRCNVSDEIMTFLGKIYFLNPGAVYKNFGSSMERLMAHGDLQIESWASSVKGFKESGALKVSRSQPNNEHWTI